MVTEQMFAVKDGMREERATSVDATGVTATGVDA
jgi:hypothetical protein